MISKEDSNYVWIRLQRRLEEKLQHYKSEKKRSEFKQHLEKVSMYVAGLNDYIGKILERIKSAKTYKQVLDQIDEIRRIVGKDFILSQELKDKIDNELNWSERYAYDILRDKYLSKCEKEIVDVASLDEKEIIDIPGIGKGPVPNLYLVIRPKTLSGFLQFADSRSLQDMAKRKLIEIEGPFDLKNNMERYLKALRKAILRVIGNNVFQRIIKEPIGKGALRKGNIKGWPIISEAIIFCYKELLPLYSPTPRRYGFKRKGKIDIYHGELINDILEILKGAFPKLLSNLTREDIIARIQYSHKKHRTKTAPC